MQAPPGRLEGRPIQVDVADLRIEGFRQRVRLGCTEAERAFPQVVRIDFRVRSVVTAALATDDLAFAVDYERLADSVRQLASTGEWRLLETLAADLARAALESGPSIVEVEVKVTKSILHEADGVSLSLVVQPVPGAPTRRLDPPPDGE